MRTDFLKGMLHAETTADRRWNGPSVTERETYLKAHPNGRHGIAFKG
jgi:hypothetical protein